MFPAKQQLLSSEPVPSVTENTTRTLEPVLIGQRNYDQDSASRSGSANCRPALNWKGNAKAESEEKTRSRKTVVTFITLVQRDRGI